jgi:hypothetical protein
LLTVHDCLLLLFVQADINNISLTDDVARLGSWSLAAMEERQSQHLNYAKQCWELNY